VSAKDLELIKELRSNKDSIKKIAKNLKLAISTIYKH
jgi:DNA-binding CsgD family transcriptional regulator